MTFDSHEIEARFVKDPVHDLIKFSSLVWTLIDTRQFQRLRDIKQLGVSYYIWPGASHNRFEHCLGVAHLARTMVEGLRSRQPELGITDRDVDCVEIAGLCHDLGHGPWSHVWDGQFIPAALKDKDENWSHEDASEMMFDALLDKNDIEFPEENRNFVKDLIKGAPNLSKDAVPREKPFLFEIVANKRNGIDVDKFDYIARDCRAVGETAPATSLLIESARVINDEICYDIKHANLLYELCHCRYKLHKLIYNHKTARAIEYMIVDALLAAESKLKIAEQIRDPERYVYLTDDIMPQIERERGDKDLEKSREIFDRIRVRDLYRCVDWKALEWDVKDKVKNHLTTEKIINKAKELYRLHAPLVDSDGSPVDYSELSIETVNNLTQEDVIMDFTTLHYGMKEHNPIDYIHFYGKRNNNQSFHAGTGDYATIRPKCFAEMLLRIYSKNAACFGLIQAGYNALMAELAELSQDEDGDQNPPTPPLTEAPTTPRQAPTAPPSRDTSLGDLGLATPLIMSRTLALKNTPPEDIEMLSKTKTRTKGAGSLFKKNVFSSVDPSYHPPSPSHKGRKSKRGETPSVTASPATTSPIFDRGSGGSEIVHNLAPPTILRPGSPSPNSRTSPSRLMPLGALLRQDDSPSDTASSSTDQRRIRRGTDDEQSPSKRRKHL